MNADEFWGVLESNVSPGLQEAAAKRFDDALQLGHNELVGSESLK